MLTNTTQIASSFPEPLSFSLPTLKSPPMGKSEATDKMETADKATVANNTAASDRDRQAIYIASNYDPMINRVPRLLRSVSEINTLLAVDLATGQEMWRWQPTRNMQFDKIVTGKHRLYLSDDKQIVAIEDGFEEPMPENPRERWMLARHLLSAQYGWPPDPNDFMRRFARWLSPPASPLLAHLQEESPDENETQMALLSLGQNSVIPLVEFIHHTVTEHEKNSQALTGRNLANAYDLTGPLDILFDLNDRSVVPSLIAELERADTARNARCAGAVADPLERHTSLARPVSLRTIAVHDGRHERGRALFCLSAQSTVRCNAHTGRATPGRAHTRRSDRLAPDAPARPPHTQSSLYLCQV